MSISVTANVSLRLGRLTRLYGLLPVVACFYSAVAFPLLALAFPSESMESRIEHRIFWPAMAALSLFMTARLLRAGARPPIPAVMVCLLAYLLLAGMSVGWALAPDISFRRYVQQILIIISVALPVVLCADRNQLLRDLFICFGIAALLNFLFLFGRPPTPIGHAGFYDSKNILGQLAALAFLFALGEIVGAGTARRLRGLAVLLMALVLLLESQSKTSLGLVALSPILAGLAIALSATLRISPAVIVISLLLLAGAVGFIAFDALDASIEDVSIALFQDPTFTGRTYIWSFVDEMVARRPLLGWGYQSFWLVGLEAPSVREAPGFIGTMPHAHNGYLDVLLETGWVGLAILILTIITAIDSIGKLIDHELRRAWFTLSVLLFIVFHNLMESTWVRGADLPWLVFVILAAHTTPQRILLSVLRPWAAACSGFRTG